MSEWKWNPITNLEKQLYYKNKTQTAIQKFAFALKGSIEDKQNVVGSSPTLATLAEVR